MPAHPGVSEAKRMYFFVLSLTALGVVFGDIGTSPLYALREAFHGEYSVEPTRDHVLGILSLVFWSLVLVVSVKYLVIVLRADNDGEGGILALMSQVHPEHGGQPMSKARRTGFRRLALVSLGLFGAALLYGDGMITPAISVLSAMEGLEVAQPALKPFVLPGTVVVLILLFALQRRGTAVVGTLFGPITIVWFLALAAMGIRGILLAPEVLVAFNPIYGARFLIESGLPGFLVLGAVFLVVTGCESLYADMGHFGRGPIRFSWFAVVLPALMLNYLGQGALVLSSTEPITNPFFQLAPTWAIVPLIALATLATVVASQALISGAFSLTMQAVQLGYSPRVEVRHTSAREFGQVYVPPVNWALMVATIWIVLEFGSSTRLAAVYGIAISTTMLMTTMLLFVVARERWGWGRFAAVGVIGFFLVVELAFFAANIVKIGQGGWFPLVVGAVIFTMMTTWRRGRKILAERLRESAVPIKRFVNDLGKKPHTRVRGNAVYMTGNPDYAPNALVKNLEHNRVLHMRVAFLSFVTEDMPYVKDSERVHLDTFPNGIFRVVARYGFMEEPNAVAILATLRGKGLDFPIGETTFFLGREHLISTNRPGMAPWREKLFGFMARNSQQAPAYFGIPPDRVIEVGSQIEI